VCGQRAVRAAARVLGWAGCAILYCARVSGASGRRGVRRMMWVLRGWASKKQALGSGRAGGRVPSCPSIEGRDGCRARGGLGCVRVCVCCVFGGEGVGFCGMRLQFLLVRLEVVGGFGEGQKWS
jgi:hypothetical protein